MRLSLALDAGLPRPESLLCLRPPLGYDLAGIPATIVHGHAAEADAWTRAGYPVFQSPPDTAEMTLVCLPRAKDHAKAMIATAAAITSGWVVVDGQKTDGVDSLHKLLRARVEVGGSVTKAHGRLFWFQAQDLSDLMPDTSRVDGLKTAFGLFSADRIDPGSALLVEALPETLSGSVADFGAGWGYLTREALRRGAAQVTAIEVEAAGAEVIKANLDDPRLQVVWGDATVPRGPFDTVIMNPPFHRGRDGAPDLGQAFITSAAASLVKTGSLWLVANRHLPYEATLSAAFAEVELVREAQGFKVFRARRPRSGARRR